MNTVSWILISFSIFIPFFSRAEPLSLSVNAEAAILINAETGQILYEKNAYAPYFPASITKVATALYALKQKGNDLDTLIAADQESIASISEEAKKRSNYTLPSHWIEKGSTHIGIKKGEELTFRDLLNGMLISSGNDAANVIAQFVSESSMTNFITALNEYLKTIGCKNTTFYNPHGLHHPKHQTTAHDMALIAQEALKNPLFCQIVKTVRYTRPQTNKQEATTLVQSNRLLRNGRFYYPKAIGVKTGYTSLASNTFVAAAKNEDRTLIVVLLKTKDRNDIFADAIKMFETAFNQPKIQRNLLTAGPQKFTLVIEGGEQPLKTYAKEDFVIEYYPAEEPSIKCFLQWQKAVLPIAKDQPVGELIFVGSDQATIKKVTLYAQENATQTWLSWFKRLL